MKQIRKNNRKWMALLSLVGLTGFLTAGSAKATAAYLSSREAAENRAAFADNRIVIEEPDFDPNTKTDPGTTVYPKRVNLKNNGNIPVYARVRLVFSDPRAEACTSFTNSEGTFPATELSAHLPQGWSVGDDDSSGYYYCTEPLAPGSATPDLIRTVTTTFDAEHERVDYEIYVRAESIQTVSPETGVPSQRAWKDAWAESAF